VTRPRPYDAVVSAPIDSAAVSPDDLPELQWRWLATGAGEPGQVLEFSDGPLPRPGPGQTLIDVAAAGVNFADGLCCRGTYQDRVAPPFTPGLEVAGRVVGGALPAGIAIGERVVGTTALPAGGWARFALARAQDLFAVSDDVSDAVAAASHIVFQTAWLALRHRARLRSGEVVVVQAAGGSTGSACVQVARSSGADLVVAIAGGRAKCDAALAAGAHVALDYRALDADAGDIVAQVKALTAGRGADVVVDPVGSTLENSRRMLAFEGRLVVLGFAGGDMPGIRPNHLLVRNLDAIGVAWPAYKHHRPDLVAEAQRGIDALLSSGAATPVIAGVRPMAEAADALADLEGGRTVGKWVLVP
jgi:NADPH:quinone reductase